MTKRGYELAKVSKNLKNNVIYFNGFEPVELQIKKIKYKKVQQFVDITVRNNRGKSFKTSRKYVKKFTKKTRVSFIQNIVEELPDDFENISSINISNYPNDVVIDDTPVAIVLQKPSTCIICTAEIQLEDNTWLKMEQLIVGQRIKLHDGKIATIDAITKSSYQGNIYGVVTDYHPIEFNGKLVFANEVLKPTGKYDDYVYNIGAYCDDDISKANLLDASVKTDDTRATKIRIKDFKYNIACAFSNEVLEGEPTYSKEWGTTEGSLYNLVKKKKGFVNLDTWEFKRDKEGIAIKIVQIFNF